MNFDIIIFLRLFNVILAFCWLITIYVKGYNTELLILTILAIVNCLLILSLDDKYIITTTILLFCWILNLFIALKINKND